MSYPPADTLPARSCLLTLTTQSGHTFRLHLRVVRGDLDQLTCGFRINQFDRDAELRPGQGLLVLAPEAQRPALRAQVGLPRPGDFLVPLSPQVLAQVEARAHELLRPFLP